MKVQLIVTVLIGSAVAQPGVVPAAAPKTATAPTTAPATTQAVTTQAVTTQAVTIDLSSTKSAAKTLFLAISNGDRQAVAAAFFAADAPQRQLADAMADFIVAGKHLGDAARARFGAAGDPLGRGMIDPNDLSKIEAAVVKETGDAATLDVPGQTRPMSFRRQDGQWKLVVTDFGGAAPENIAKRTQLVKLMTEALEESTAEIAAGKFKTPDEAATAIQSRLNTAMVRSYRPATTRAAREENDKVRG